MATDKPRFTITIPDEMYAKVAQYKEERRFSTQSKAIQSLIGAGLAAVFGEQPEANAQRDVDAEALAIAKDYTTLDTHGKKLIRLVMKSELERMTDGKTPQVVQAEPPTTKIIPLFPAAAGPGEPQDDIAFSDYEVPIKSKAEFAVKVSGDSMEPELHDGDIVTCTRRYPDAGEIAAIMVNGFLFVKQVEYDDDGSIHLYSINRERSALDLYLHVDTTDTVKCYGTLIHRVMPPIGE